MPPGGIENMKGYHIAPGLAHGRLLSPGLNLVVTQAGREQLHPLVQQCKYDHDPRRNSQSTRLTSSRHDLFHIGLSREMVRHDEKLGRPIGKKHARRSKWDGRILKGTPAAKFQERSRVHTRRVPILCSGLDKSKFPCPGWVKGPHLPHFHSAPWTNQYMHGMALNGAKQKV